MAVDLDGGFCATAQGPYSRGLPASHEDATSGRGVRITFDTSRESCDCGGMTVAAKSDADVRTVIIQSPSVARELKFVLFVVFQIVFWSAMIMGGDGSKRAVAAKSTTGFEERPFSDLDPEDQRLYRKCIEGTTEAEDVRATTKSWPSVAEMAKRLVPPFAPDPLDHAGYTWTLRRDGTLVNYVGSPGPGSTRATFMIIVLEPDPGTSPEPGAVPDETHHKLPDGTLLHVSIWIGPKPLAAPVWIPPLENGWRRITMTNP